MAEPMPTDSARSVTSDASRGLAAVESDIARACKDARRDAIFVNPNCGVENV